MEDFFPYSSHGSSAGVTCASTIRNADFKNFYQAAKGSDYLADECQRAASPCLLSRMLEKSQSVDRRFL